VRILALTAGAGSMYCGSCLRDNALAAQLLGRGHDVTLLPVYTPTLTDEANVSSERVFFGGVSVWLEQNVPLFRHTPPVLDRLWDSGRVIRALAGRSVSVDPSGLGSLTVSMLEGEAGFQGKEHRKLAQWLKEQAPFDLASLPNSMLLGLARTLKETLHRPLACTLQGEDLFLEGLPDPYRGQAKALIRRQAEWVDGFVSVSAYYADFMAADLGLPRERIHVVPLGVSPGDFQPRPERTPGPFVFGYFARVAPEKGLHLLAEAYAVMRRQKGLPPSRLEVAGYLAPEHRPYLAQVEERLRQQGLGDELRYHGTLDRAHKVSFLQGLDVLSVPSPYAEPKGLYLLEALACGVPVVQPRHGAFPEILERAGGGRLFAPGDVNDLAETLLGLSRDPAAAHRLGAEGAAGVRRHYTAAQMADRALEVYSRLTGGSGAGSGSSGAPGEADGAGSGSAGPGRGVAAGA
jgi:glycosyltransferase involved in cell wall biosynthesis